MGQGNILFTEWINMQKLAILGVRKEYVYVALLMVGILIMYILLRPVVQWLLLNHSHKLLTYVISSLLMLVILLFTAFMRGENSGVRFMPLIKYALLTLTMFGIALFVINLVYFLLQKWLKKSV